MGKIKKFKLFKEDLSTNNTSILIEFVNFLPTDLPKRIDDIASKSVSLGKDGAFYMLIGELIEKFGKDKDLLSDLINDDDYEDTFFDLLSNKYSEGIIEW